jgi:hypothetical protein
MSILAPVFSLLPENPSSSQKKGSNGWGWEEFPEKGVQWAQ